MKLQEMIKLFESHCIYEKNLSVKTDLSTLKHT